MKALQPVIWSTGTFLTPQHLQAEDRFIQSTLQFRMDALAFRPYGFTRLQVDQEALASGNFALSHAQGILPDGSIFDIPDCDAAPPAKALAPCFEPDQEEIDVHLAIPEYRQGGVNVSVSRQGVDSRYLAEVAVFRDENSGKSERAIQVARKNLRLIVGDNRRGMSTLRIARVKRSAGDTFQVDASSVPPLLDFGASEYLMALARAIVEIMSAKISILAGMRRQKNLSLADFTVSDVASFWLLYTLNTHFPQLRQLFESHTGHPQVLFSSMTGLAAALTTFSLNIGQGDLPAYNHEELGACFEDLGDKLRLLIETVVPSNFVALALKAVRPSIYATSLAEDKYFANTRMYLAISSEMDKADLIRRVPELVKVCSANHIEHLIRQALAGIQLTYVPVPPSSIPIKTQYQYFSLNQSGLAWEAVGRARNLAAYVPGDFPDPQLELIVVLPEAG